MVVVTIPARREEDPVVCPVSLFMNSEKTWLVHPFLPAVLKKRTTGIMTAKI